jgi:hypothetical protein
MAEAASAAPPLSPTRGSGWAAAVEAGAVAASVASDRSVAARRVRVMVDGSREVG